MSACLRARSRTRRCWPRRWPASTRRTPTRGPMARPPLRRGGGQRAAAAAALRLRAHAGLDACRAGRRRRPSPSWSRRSARRANEVELGPSFERAIELHGIVMAVEMAHNLHRDYEQGARQAEPGAARSSIERGRAYPAIDYTRALAGDRARSTRRSMPSSTSTTPSSPPPRPARRRAASTARATRSFCTTWTYLGTPAVTLPLLQGENGMPHRRAARRPPRQRCAPVAHGALACRNRRGRRAPPRPQASAAAQATPSTRKGQRHDELHHRHHRHRHGDRVPRHHAVVGAGAAAHHHRRRSCSLLLICDFVQTLRARRQRWRQELAAARRRRPLRLTYTACTEAAAAHRRAATLSSEELVGACLDRIAELEPQISAWAFLDRERALAQAQGRRRSAQGGQGRRARCTALPVGVKDIIDTADMPTEHGCAGLQGPPARSRMRPASRRCAAPAPSSSARPSRRSLQPTLRRARATRATSSTRPAAPPRARPPLSPPAWCRRRSARRPAAPSSARPPSAASTASSRRSASSRAPAC